MVRPTLDSVRSRSLWRRFRLLAILATLPPTGFFSAIRSQVLAVRGLRGRWGLAARVRLSSEGPRSRASPDPRPSRRRSGTVSPRSTRCCSRCWRQSRSWPRATARCGRRRGSPRSWRRGHRPPGERAAWGAGDLVGSGDGIGRDAARLLRDRLLGALAGRGDGGRGRAGGRRGRARRRSACPGVGGCSACWSDSGRGCAPRWRSSPRCCSLAAVWPRRAARRCGPWSQLIGGCASGSPVGRRCRR